MCHRCSRKAIYTHGGPNQYAEDVNTGILVFSKGASFGPARRKIAVGDFGPADTTPTGKRRTAPQSTIDASPVVTLIADTPCSFRQLRSASRISQVRSSRRVGNPSTQPFET